MAEVTFLGTGAADSGRGRAKSSLLLRGAGVSLLLDAGEPCALRLEETGVAPDSVDAVFISHAHADHISGLPLLLQANRLAGRRRPLEIWLPAATIGPLESWLGALGLDGPTAGFDLRLHPLECGRTMTVGNIQAEAFATSHDRENGRESFGFVVRGPQRRMVYSSDLGSAADLGPVVRKPVDVLVCEMAHITPAELAAVLRGVRLELLLLTHFSRERQEFADDIRRELDRELPDAAEVMVATEGEKFIA